MNTERHGWGHEQALFTELNGWVRGPYARHFFQCRETQGSLIRPSLDMSSMAFEPSATNS